MKFMYIALATMLAVSASADTVGTNVSNNSNQFGFKLMQEAHNDEAEVKNLMVSPLSAHYALSMTLNGTNNETRQEMLAVLGYTPRTSVEQINLQNKKLLKSLNIAPLSETELKKLQPWQLKPAVVGINNSAWVTNGKTTGVPYNFAKPFAGVLKNAYGVDKVTALDFKAKESADVINKWTNDMTRGLIPEIINADILGDMMWVLINTTYIEGQWSASFRKTENHEFTLLNGKQIKSEGLAGKVHGRYLKNDEVEVVEIAIAQSNLKAYVVLPLEKNGFQNLSSREGIWTMNAWQTILANLQHEELILTMPKFSFEYEVTMKKADPITEALGLQFLFTNDTDLTNMDGPGSRLSKVGIIKQATKVEWDYKGVKAAAATLVGGVERTSVPVEPQIEMIVDRPFFFAIYDEATKNFLFLGQVVDPTSKK